MAEPRICAEPGCAVRLGHRNASGFCRVHHGRRSMAKQNADPAFEAHRIACVKAASHWLQEDTKRARLFRNQSAERLAAMRADPEFNARCHNSLDFLTAEQRADYDVLVRSGYRRAEALASLGIEEPRP